MRLTTQSTNVVRLLLIKSSGCYVTGLVFLLSSSPLLSRGVGKVALPATHPHPVQVHYCKREIVFLPT